MTDVLVSIDPGMETGIFIGHFSSRTPLTPVGWVQVQGGFDGVERWIDESPLIDIAQRVVFERFTPRPMERSYKRDELEALVIEGLVRRVRKHELHFQPPTAMNLGGEPQAARKLLKKLNWWQTGRMVGSGDANDANAATLHAIAHMRHIKHAPTIEMILPHLLGETK